MKRLWVLNLLIEWRDYHATFHPVESQYMKEFKRARRAFSISSGVLGEAIDKAVEELEVT